MLAKKILSKTAVISDLKLMYLCKSKKKIKHLILKRILQIQKITLYFINLDEKIIFCVWSFMKKVFVIFGRFNIYYPDYCENKLWVKRKTSSLN